MWKKGHERQDRAGVDFETQAKLPSGPVILGRGSAEQRSVAWNSDMSS